MSMPCTTQIISCTEHEEDEVLVNLYRHHDGYLKDHGKELVAFLRSKPLIQNLGLRTTRPCAHGASCLAAQMVAHFKKGVGDFHLFHADQKAQYNYAVYVIEDKRIHLLVMKDDVIILNKDLDDITEKDLS